MSEQATDQESNDGGGPMANRVATVGPPRWVKVLAVVIIALIVVFVMVQFVGGGGHGPGRHGSASGVSLRLMGGSGEAPLDAGPGNLHL